MFRKKNNIEIDNEAADKETIDLKRNMEDVTLETIQVTEYTYLELLRIKNKNECANINEVIEGMIELLKENNNVPKGKQVSHVEIYYDDSSAETIFNKECDIKDV